MYKLCYFRNSICRRDCVFVWVDTVFWNVSKTFAFTLHSEFLFLKWPQPYSVQRPACYDAWIDMYAGEDFEKEVKDYIAMVDAACKTADESTLKEMEKHFIMSCKLEHMFWDQAQTKMEWPKIA